MELDSLFFALFSGDAIEMGFEQFQSEKKTNLTMNDFPLICSSYNVIVTNGKIDTVQRYDVVW